tara:strand:- start:71 stop:844 length:774 start_codon:yes stop_codon:yes gene_type:complete
MPESTFSPDGKWMWTGTEWIPAPPSDEIEHFPKQENIPDIQLNRLKKDFYSFPNSVDFAIFMLFVVSSFLLFYKSPILSHFDYLGIDCSNLANTLTFGDTVFYQGDSEYDEIKSNCTSIQLEAQALVAFSLGSLILISSRINKSVKYKRYRISIDNFDEIIRTILSKSTNQQRADIIRLVNKRKLETDLPRFGNVVRLLDEIFGLMSVESASEFAESQYFGTYTRWQTPSKIWGENPPSSTREEYFLLAKIIIKKYW